MRACLTIVLLACASAAALLLKGSPASALSSTSLPSMSSASAPPGRPFLASKPYLSLDVAKAVADACRMEAQRNNWTVVISIVDDGGNLMYLERMDSTQLGSIAVAQDKAASALLFKRPTKAFSDMVLDKGSVNMMALRGAVAVEGGVPLAVNGVVVGAVGISGVTSVQDGQVAGAGLSYFNSFYNSGDV